MRYLGSTVLWLAARLGLALAFPAAAAEPDLIDRLLDLPAPVPDWRKTPAAQVFEPGVDDEDDLVSILKESEARGQLPAINDDARQKLLDICLEKPEAISSAVSYLPNTPQAHDRLKALYDRRSSEKDAQWREPLHDLLMLQSRYFREDLIAAAKRLPDGKNSWGWDVKGSALERLAQVEWAAAEPIVLEQQRNPDARAVVRAMIVQYEHESTAGAARAAAVETVRARLKAVVGDRKAHPWARNAACEALLGSPWTGRDEYYLSLFADPTLMELEDDHMLMAPLARITASDPDRWIPVISKLVGSKDRATHDSAVACLIQFHLESARADALRPLLPWLADSQWSSARDRLRLIQSLDRVELPQAIPGLIKVVESESDFELAGAAASLAHQHATAAQTGTALRQAMAREKREIHRREIAKAMLTCGVLSDEEIVAAIEAFARQLSTVEGRQKLEATRELVDPQTIQPQVSLGSFLSTDAAVKAGICAKLLARADAMAGAEPDVALMIRWAVSDWPDPEVDRSFARRLGAGEVKDEEIRTAAGRAERMRKNASEPLRDISKKGGVWGGIAAGLLGEDDVSASILSGPDDRAKEAMLATARLARTPMPLAEAARLMESKIPRAAHAAELYLISQDSAEARRLVLARHKGEAIILGGRSAFDPGHNTFAPLGQTAEKLRTDVCQPGGPDEIFALISEGYWGGAGQIIIRIHKARGRETATMTLDRGGGKERSRELGEEELRRLRGFVADHHVNDLAPLNQQVWDGVQYEYIHLTRDGGRRVFMNNPDTGDSARTAYDRLTRLFHRLSAAAPTKVAYAALDKIPGAKIVASDEDKPITDVWGDGEDLRVYIGRYGEGSWHALRANVVAEKTEWPAGFPRPLRNTRREDAANPVDDQPPGLPINTAHNSARWKITAGADSFWVGQRFPDQMEGLWHWRKGEKPRRLTPRGMELLRPVATPDGKWVLAALWPGDRDKPHPMMRIFTSDGETRQVDLPSHISFETVAYVAEHAKVLVQGFEGDGNDQRERFWLVDPASGAVQEVQGEFGPLLHQYTRPLQPAAVLKEGKPQPGLYWAALPQRTPQRQTSIGLYDPTGFKFSPKVTLAGLQFSSIHMWVRQRPGENAADKTGAWEAWIAVNGDLIRVPLADPAR